VMLCSIIFRGEVVGADIVSLKGKSPDREETIMTVKGSVREEFIASMDLSRF